MKCFFPNRPKPNSAPKILLVIIICKQEYYEYQSGAVKEDFALSLASTSSNLPTSMHTERMHYQEHIGTVKCSRCLRKSISMCFLHVLSQQSPASYKAFHTLLPVVLKSPFFTMQEVYPTIQMKKSVLLLFPRITIQIYKISCEFKYIFRGGNTES